MYGENPIGLVEQVAVLVIRRYGEVWGGVDWYRGNFGRIEHGTSPMHQ